MQQLKGLKQKTKPHASRKELSHLAGLRSLSALEGEKKQLPR